MCKGLTMAASIEPALDLHQLELRSLLQFQSPSWTSRNGDNDGGNIFPTKQWREWGERIRWSCGRKREKRENGDA
ncbi:hypothetical protein TIFTF001_026134 [Ficus carica]|uniref:Uncharacterized protein n=1 Tax=Ficus carica TaxID=3494 RepID=A0AA88DEU4_FICCA|nr:hypothetical protein TIFTF001_026134 [Ficus carica]